jgi:hypothetical protein
VDRRQAPLEEVQQRWHRAIRQARLLHVDNKGLRAAASALCDEALAAELAHKGVLDRRLPPVPTRGPRPEHL